MAATGFRCSFTAELASGRRVIPCFLFIRRTPLLRVFGFGTDARSVYRFAGSAAIANLFVCTRKWRRFSSDIGSGDGFDPLGSLVE